MLQYGFHDDPSRSKTAPGLFQGASETPEEAREETTKKPNSSTNLENPTVCFGCLAFPRPMVIRGLEAATGWPRRAPLGTEESSISPKSAHERLRAPKDCSKRRCRGFLRVGLFEAPLLRDRCPPG
eukprot:9497740-Pyramimonas_sp.AAC.1